MRNNQNQEIPKNPRLVDYYIKKHQYTQYIHHQHHHNQSSSNIMNIKDWRQALHSPPPYRLGNRTFRLHFHVIFIIFVVALFIIFASLYPASLSSWKYQQLQLQQQKSLDFYNSTYPLTTPYIANGNGAHIYKIGLIADLDTNSKSKTENNVWLSYLKIGFLNYNPNDKNVVISWDKSESIELKSSYSMKGRGMELSELIVYNGKLLTFDDRTGLIYEIQNNKAIPWVLLTDGDGKISKGFKSEWATVKDKQLYIGSMGKEWTTSQGDYENDFPMYIKIVNVFGEVKHINWKNQYLALRESLGIKWPGYMIHESGMWSSKHRKWFFLPRRCSTEKYNETLDEHMGCNVLIKSDEYFSNIKTIKVGKLNPTHGYSSFKFIPDTDDSIIIALSTEELNGKTSTYISAFTVDGEIIMKEEKVPTDLKYEGIEFI